MGFFDFLTGGAPQIKGASQFISPEYLQGLENVAQADQNRPDTSSFAEALLKQQRDAQMQNANSLAASARGNISPALLQRQVMNQQAQSAQQANQQGAVIRAQEALQNRALNDQMAMQYRQMGLQAAGQQAGLNTGVAQANANFQAQNNAANAGIFGSLINAAGSIATGGILSGGGGKGASGTMGNQAGSSYGGSMYASHGGKVPGKSKISGDDEKNDTVPAMLSPGEIVIPRSASNDEDKAHEFLHALMNNKKSKGGKVESYGKVLESHRKLNDRVAKLESLLKKKG
jgi:hypothetical protein